VIDAATRLFVHRGVAEVTMGDIAAEVGLARNSLYRYFPDKDHILATWFRRELAPLLARSEAIEAGPGSPVEKLDAWLDLQLDYLTAPEHRAMITAASDMLNLTPDVRAEIGAGHRQLYGTLEQVVSDALRSNGLRRRHDPRVLVVLVAGMLRSAAELIDSGESAADISAEVRRAAHALVGDH